MRLDLAEVQLLAVPGSFESRGRVAVEVRNVSGVTLIDADVAPTTRHSTPLPDGFFGAIFGFSSIVA